MAITDYAKAALIIPGDGTNGGTTPTVGSPNRANTNIAGLG